MLLATYHLLLTTYYSLFTVSCSECRRASMPKKFRRETQDVTTGAAPLPGSLP